MRVVALTSGRNVPSSRFRVRQYVAPLRELGIEVEEWRSPIEKYDPAPTALLSKAARALKRRRAQAPSALLPRASRALKRVLRLPGVAASRFADVVWLERELLPGRSSLEHWTGRPRLFDVDDALWLQGSSGFSERIVRACAGVIAGNAFLAEHYREAGARVWIVPTAVDTEVWTPRREVSGDTWTIGWIGTSSNLPYLLPLEGALAAFLERHGDARLLVVSDGTPDFTRLPADRWRFAKWSAHAEVGLVQRMDVGLMPLPDTDWARGKCAAKMLLYMAAGIPVVVSPVGTNVEVLALGEVGLAARDPEQWLDALAALYLDRPRARRMGLLGRAVVEAEYSVRAVAPRLAAIFREVARGH